METRPKGASSIEIELTETAPNISEAELIKGIHRLRELGFRIAMDDFGSGYSSLNRFCKFHFDRIKLDSEVTRQVGSLKGHQKLHLLEALKAFASHPTREVVCRVCSRSCEK